MTTITVFGAAGQGGSRIVAEAVGRGHQVRAAVRDTSRLTDAPESVIVVAGDSTDADSVRELAAGTDVFVVAIGGPGRSLYADAADTLLTVIADLPEGQRPRVVHMGGGATLTTPDGTRFLELPSFPAEYLDPAIGQAAALDRYQGSTGVDWTYVSPPPVDFHLGERTGGYRTGLNQPVTDDNGNASLSYEDFAVVVVDEIETPRHTGRRFTAGY